MFQHGPTEPSPLKSNEQPATGTTGAKDRPWHMRAWSGINVTGWFRALVRNRFAVSPTRVPMAAILTGLSFFNSSLSILQSLLYGRRIRRTELVEDPIFVVGHWRSGTTLVHELLVCDPRHTYPDTYACFSPNHFLLTQRLLVRWIGFLLPPQRPMDNMAIRWEYPQEDEWALCNMGLPSPYLTILFPNRPPQHPEYLDLRGISEEDRERWKRKMLWFLRCLTVREPKRIVLKTPVHTARIRTLREMFPRARFVHVVRDPYVIFPSTMHTWRRMYRYHGVQVPRYEDLEQYVLDTFVRMYEVFEEDVRDIPPSHFCEVRYEDLVRDPVGQLRAIYDGLELDGFDQVLPAARDYASRTADYKPNRYELSPETRDRITARWSSYTEKYGYAVPDAGEGNG